MILLNLSFVRFFLLFSKFRFQRICDSWFLFFVVTPYFLGSLATNKFRFWFVCYRVCRCKWLLGSIGFLPYGCFLMVAYLQILIILTFVLVFFFFFVKPKKKSNITFSTLVFIALSSAASVECCSIIVDIVGFVAYFCYCCYCVKNIYD